MDQLMHVVVVSDEFNLEGYITDICCFLLEGRGWQTTDLHSRRLFEEAWEGSLECWKRPTLSVKLRTNEN